MNNHRARMKAQAGSLDYIPVTNFQTVSFYDAKAERQIILLYSLGQDGIVREFAGEKGWKAFPVQKDEHFEVA